MKDTVDDFKWDEETLKWLEDSHHLMTKEEFRETYMCDFTKEIEMAKQPSMAQQEKDWQAQDDAHALARAEEIKNDPNRLKNAAAKAQQMHNEAKKHADSMKKVANKAPKSVAKTSTKKK